MGPPEGVSRLEWLRHRRWLGKISRGAERRGPWWAEILSGVALSYPGCCYVEVGVALGSTINVVAPCCREVHGCDVSEAHALPRGARFWHMNSDDFFARYDGAAPQLVFIDGGHTYDQVKRDYENAARILAPGGTIALHDTWPERAEETVPERSGDVWRLRDEITAEKLTFKRFPGLTLVRPDP